MGVANTLPNYKTFTFDGTNSAQYGVYITGQGVFNAPERNVEMIEIAGRNGAYALDKGNFNNIEVTYPASIVAETESDFATAVSNLRNWLCSKTGYKRLTDDYNPNEYRMCIYKSGLDVAHEGLLTGEFNLVFDCKPERWLTSGETATTVASGGKITNPTLFASKPQLQVYGYGEITLGNAGAITVENGEIGTIRIANGESMDQIVGAAKTQTLDVSALNAGDDILVGSVSFDVIDSRIASQKHIQAASITSATNATAVASLMGTMSATIDISTDEITFAKGTADSLSGTVVYSETIEGTAYTYTVTLAVAYDGDSTISYSSSVTPDLPYIGMLRLNEVAPPDIFAVSTKSALGTPLYIDLDIGEAYSFVGGTAVSGNNTVSIPAELPTLPPGETTVTFDNTFTKVDIVPRWWKV